MSDPKNPEELPDDVMDISEEEVMLIWDDEEDDLPDVTEAEDDIAFEDGQ
jgi:hypothetical protein